MEKSKEHRRKEEKREIKRQHTTDTLANIARQQDPECLGVSNGTHNRAAMPGSFGNTLSDKICSLRGAILVMASINFLL